MKTIWLVSVARRSSLGKKFGVLKAFLDMEKAGEYLEKYLDDHYDEIYEIKMEKCECEFD